MIEDKEIQLQRLKQEYRERQESYGEDPTEEQELELEVLRLDIDSLRTSIKYRTAEKPRKQRLINAESCKTNEIKRPLEKHMEPHTANEMRTLLSMVKPHTARQEQLIELYYLQGKKMGEIADELSISHSTVSRTLTRGRNSMREKGELIRLAMLVNAGDDFDDAFIFDMRIEQVEAMLRRALTSVQYEEFCEYMSGKNETEIAQERGIAPSTVSRTCKRAVSAIYHLAPINIPIALIGPTGLRARIVNDKWEGKRK